MNRKYRQQSLGNVLRMGHCAPAVMQTIVDISAAGEGAAAGDTPSMEWLVKLSAGMPGGIGNTGFECGGVTSPLVLLGLGCGLGEIERGLPVLFDKGHALCQHFLECHQTMQCRQIRGKDRFPRHCFRPILLSPELYLDAADANHADAIPGETRECYSRLYAYMAQNKFHCAQAVFDHLGGCPKSTCWDTQGLNRGSWELIDPHKGGSINSQTHFLDSSFPPEIYDAASAFIGGTLFMGMTCSAFAAGVMALGLSGGEIENNPWRVLRMLVIMSTGGNAFDEGLNKFNRSMNRGTLLAKWFRKAFGSTQCQAITQCDFSSPAGVSQYIEGDCIHGCKQIAEKTAGWVRQILASENSEQMKGARNE